MRGGRGAETTQRGPDTHTHTRAPLVPEPGPAGSPLGIIGLGRADSSGTQQQQTEPSSQGNDIVELLTYVLLLFFFFFSKQRSVVFHMHCRSRKRDCVGDVSMRGSLLFTGGRFCLRFCLHKLSLPCGASSRIKQLCEYLSVLKVLSSEHTPPAFGTSRLQDRKAESSAGPLIHALPRSLR